MQQKHGERGLEWQDSENYGRVWKKHDEMFGKSMVKEERNGDRNPSEFWNFIIFLVISPCFFRFILNLSALFLLLPGRSAPQTDVNFIMVHHGIKTHLITGS